MQNKDNKNKNAQKTEQSNLSEEELKKKNEASLKEFIEKYTKNISVESALPKVKGDVEWVAKELLKLREEVVEKKKTFLEQQHQLNKKIEDLSKTGKLKIDTTEQKKTQDGFKQYENLLDDMIAETEKELSFCASLLAPEPPKTVKVLKTDFDDAEKFLSAKIRELKKFVKSVSKNLRVSYSRYNFGLESQLRRLEYLEVYMNRLEQQKK
jgi:hypothetical protein